MEWILGGGTALGLAGVVALALYMARMAGGNRSDLHKLVQAAKDLADARRDNDSLKRRVEERDHAIEALTADLDSERKALAAATAALGRATKKLAARGDARSVAADLNSTLGMLSEMSPTPAAEGGDQD